MEPRRRRPLNTFRGPNLSHNGPATTRTRSLEGTCKELLEAQAGRVVTHVTQSDMILELAIWLGER